LAEPIALLWEMWSTNYRHSGTFAAVNEFLCVRTDFVVNRSSDRTSPVVRFFYPFRIYIPSMQNVIKTARHTRVDYTT
jgi:hypothetical protein